MSKMTLEKLSIQDTQSLDIRAENIAKLKEFFPEILTEKGIDFTVLKQLLGEEIEEAEERYSFTWNGKAQARRLAQTPSTGTLRPCKEESKDWDTTQNLFIEGDNLEVLKLLQKSYHQKVKMIYIDPPYNTGKDFIYPDDFRDNIQNYLELTGQTDEQGKKLSSNPESSGRYHTDWLNMIYPRLKLARNLLQDTGVIFVSIDDSEINNLRTLMNDVFGEDNFVAQIVWQRSKKGDAKLVANVHEYILCYARNKTQVIENGVWRRKKDGAAEVLVQYQTFKTEFDNDHIKIREAMQSWYRDLGDSDPRKNHKHYNWSDNRGLYFADNFAGPDDGRASRPRHDIFHPVTGLTCKKPSTGWRWDEEKTNWALAQDPPRIHFGLDESTIPNRKSYLEEISTEPYSSVFYRDGRSATLEVEGLVGKGCFPFPKNTDVLMELIELVTDENDLIVDFFAGSGSTGHAVMNVNEKLNSDRKFLLVQLPEKIENSNYSTIAEITKKRIRRAGETILSNNVDIANTGNRDFGFKVLKLDSSNIKPWDVDFDTLSDDLLTADEVIKPERSQEDVLFEILLKYGLDLNLLVNAHTLAGKTVFEVGAGALLVCLDKEVTESVAEAIGQLKAKLAPAVCRVVFRDAGFADDAAKVNAVQVLKQFGIDDVKSL